MYFYAQREAVSTSHCAQPNTLEYEMAIEWFHLQECFDKEWKMMHEVVELINVFCSTLSVPAYVYFLFNVDILFFFRNKGKN